MKISNKTDELYDEYSIDEIEEDINEIEEYEINDSTKKELYYTNDRFKDTDEYKEYLKRMAEVNPDLYSVTELETEDNTDDENKWFNMGSSVRNAILKNKKFVIFLIIFIIITISNSIITRLNILNKQKTENRQDITEEDMSKLGISETDVLSHPLVQEAISYLSEEEKEELLGSQHISVSQNNIEENDDNEEIKLLNTKAVNISSLYNEQKSTQDQESEIIESELYYIKGNSDLQVVLDGSVKIIHMIGIENVSNTNQLKNILNPGSKIYIEYDNNKYNINGELIAYIWLQNPEQLEEDEYNDNLLNAVMLKNGWAKTSIDDINVKHKNILIDAEDYAIYYKIGCWK